MSDAATHRFARRRFTVMADYCSSGIWCRGMVSFEAIDLPEDLRTRFVEWERRYSKRLHDEAAFERELPAFVAEGRALAVALKRHLGDDMRVHYRREPAGGGLERIGEEIPPFVERPALERLFPCGADLMLRSGGRSGVHRILERTEEAPVGSESDPATRELDPIELGLPRELSERLVRWNSAPAVESHSAPDRIAQRIAHQIEGKALALAIQDHVGIDSRVRVSLATPPELIRFCVEANCVHAGVWVSGEHLVTGARHGRLHWRTGFPRYEIAGLPRELVRRIVAWEEAYRPLREALRNGDSRTYRAGRSRFVREGRSIARDIARLAGPSARVEFGVDLERFEDVRTVVVASGRNAARRLLDRLFGA